MKTAEIRQAFIDYFVRENHAHVTGSPLIPAQDPTLMFTNAGMVQFKDVFLGNETKPYDCCVTAQRCLRAGGKHNDLENVGFTARHHTFFEMLGNFSFHAYFKERAMKLAWTFLTQEMNIPEERLWVTVYHEDDEAYFLWRDQIHIPENRIIRCGQEDNFWSMGDTGPCGPCSEIFYDHGDGVSGGPPGSKDADGDRYVEIWNLVFMQYDRDEHGSLHPLPSPAVDTGMGLERIAAVMQGVHNNYEIDLFVELIRKIKSCIAPVECSMVGLRVIADHLRSMTFLILDQVRPSNESRGYVLRRIIRRAMRFAVQVGLNQPFLHRCVEGVIDVMHEGYPELKAQQAIIEKVILDEEQLFLSTLTQGMNLFSEWKSKNQSVKTMPGSLVFKLHDTYGFPVDLTDMLAREHGLTLDMNEYHQHLSTQKQRSKKAHQFRTTIDALPLNAEWRTRFLGYRQWENKALIIGLYQNNQLVEVIREGQEAVVVVDETTCYAESGGQVGDTGFIRSELGVFQIKDTQTQQNVILHIGEVVSGSFQPQTAVTVSVDESRKKTILNHSATHLLHAALRSILGEHVVQKGSLVAPDRLRFDFAHSQPITLDQRHEIEQLVNQWIRANLPTSIQEMAMSDAQEMGAMALFGEKYGQKVRVVQLGDQSIELCGGTHVQSTGEIGCFRLISESGIASGVRRIEAATDQRALEWSQSQDAQLHRLAGLLKTSTELLHQRVEQLLSAKNVKKQSSDEFKSVVDQLSSQVEKISEVELLMTKVPLLGSDLRNLFDYYKKITPKDKQVVWIFVADSKDKLSLVCGISPALRKSLRAQQFLNVVTSICGGKGGGRDDFAQGYVTDYGKWREARDAVIQQIKEA